MAIYYIKDGELYHHGVKGMKWGVRRTRAQLGYDTVGKRLKKKASDAVKKMKKQQAEKKAEKKHIKEVKKANEKEAKKGIDELSDAELKQRIDRMRMEREALTLQSDINRLAPQKVSKGKQFVTDFSNNAVKPALTDAGKDLLSKYLKKTGAKMLGVDEGTVDKSMSMLEKMAKKAGFEKQIAEAEEAKRRNRKAQEQEDNDTKTKRQAEEQAAKDAKNAKAADKAAAKEQARAEKTAAKAEKEAKRIADLERQVEEEIERIIRASEAKSARSYSSENVSTGRDFVSERLALPAPTRLALPAPRDDD